jgi:hypothetical protein
MNISCKEVSQLYRRGGGRVQEFSFLILGWALCCWLHRFLCTKQTVQWRIHTTISKGVRRLANSKRNNSWEYQMSHDITNTAVVTSSPSSTLWRNFLGLPTFLEYKWTRLCWFRLLAPRSSSPSVHICKYDTRARVFGIWVLFRICERATANKLPAGRPHMEPVRKRSLGK